MTIVEARHVLRLNISFTESELRNAYRLKSKEFHPDIACDQSIAHLQMIEINQAYNLLRSKFTDLSLNHQTIRSVKSDYELYRRGIDVFERIHPSEWIRVTKNGLFDPSAIEQRLESNDAYQAATLRISEAYQIFSELINNYPNSMWVVDSCDKLKMLDKMIVRYKKMMENCT